MKPPKLNVINAYASSAERPDFLVQLFRHPTRKMPKSAVRLSDTVWFLAKGANNDAQSLTMSEGWPYWVPAKIWNASHCCAPKLRVLP